MGEMMRQFCRQQNGWAHFNVKRRGKVKEIHVAPMDGFGNFPKPHTFGARCFCHPADAMDEEGIPVFVHEHPMTEAR
jgi:hypothetical protein